MRIYFYSLVYFLFFISALSSCSRPPTAPQPPLTEYATSLALINELNKTYGALNDPGVEVYLDELASRLCSTRCAAGVQHLTFHLLHTEKPVAYSLPSSTIVISKGLLVTVQSEGELAFVLGHEIAHSALHHPWLHQGTTLSDVDISRYEAAADRTGLEIMLEAGYDPKEAPYALLHIYQSLVRFAGSNKTADDRYPPLSERISSLNRWTASSELSTSGISSTREFSRLQEHLK